MFVFMLAAVTFPDYLHFKLRIKQLELSERQVNLPSTNSQTPQSNAGQSSSAPTQSTPIGPPQNDPASLFESYARFLTLLVGLVSVLGFFLGFFIRRSLREQEEDMNKTLAKSVEGWEGEKTAIKKWYGEQSTSLESKLTEVEGLKKEVQGLKNELSTLETRVRETLKSLEDSEARYRDNMPDAGPDAAKVAEAVDNMIDS